MSSRTLLGIVILIIGILGIIVGILYLTQPPHSLPSFIPGHGPALHAKHTKRGVAALVVGAILFLGGGVMAYSDRR